MTSYHTFINDEINREGLMHDDDEMNENISEKAKNTHATLAEIESEALRMQKQRNEQI